MRIFRSLFIIFVLLFVAVPSVHALEFLVGEEAVTVEKGKIVKGSLVAAGESVRVEGTVDGDLYCAGQTVTVVGKVTGDVLCAGQSIIVEGEVGGDIRAAGQLVDILSKVAKNVTVFGQTLTIAPPGVVNGEIIGAGQTVRVSAGALKGLAVAGQLVTLNGPVGADAKVVAETLELGEKAKIAGSLDYRSDKEIIVPTGVVKGNVSYLPLPKRHDIPKVAPRAVVKTSQSWPANAVGSVLFYMGVGLVLALVAPKFTGAVVVRMKEQTLLSMLLGVLFVFFVPIAIILLCITILGIPVALIVGFLYVFILVIARIFVAFVVGQAIVDRLLPKQKENKFLPVLLGVLAVWLVFKLPFIGALFSFLALLWGTGGLVGKVFARTAKKA